MNSLTVILIVVAAILGPSAVIAATGYASIKALGRNPTSAPKIWMTMIVTLVFTEAIVIIGLLIMFQMFGR